MKATTQQTRTGRRHRRWAVALTAALAVSLVPVAGSAQPERVDDPTDACPDEVNPPAPFTDRASIPDVHVRNVDCAFNNDIARGFGDQTFRPRLDVQRDQFAALLVRTMEAADVDLPEPSDQGFQDIDGNVHADDINILAQTGITEGISATRFGPSRDLRRDQVASFILRAAAFIEDVPLENLQREDGPFTDVSQDNVHRTNINGGNVLNLVLGRTETELFPARATKRDQMASFLIRLLASLTSDEGVIPVELRATELDLTPQSSTNPAGTDHTVTATVTDHEGELLEDVDVRFEVYRDDASTGADTFTGPEHTDMIETNASGEAVMTYTGPEFDADDQIVACVLDPERETCQVDGDGSSFEGSATVGARVADTATKAWEDPVDAVDITDDLGDVRAGDELEVNRPGTDHTVNAQISDDAGEPVGDAAIRFEVYRLTDGMFSGPIETETVRSGSDGSVSFTYTGPDEEAEDRIVICRPVRDDCLVVDEDPTTTGTQFFDDPEVGAEPNALAGKIWGFDVDRIVVDMDARLATNPLGTDHTVGVTATDGDNEPVADAPVRFEVYRSTDDGVNFTGPVEEEDARTDSDGRAEITYTGPDEDAEDRIVVCVPEDGTCQVTDEDADTDGIQFTDDPEIGAEPNAVATKIWDADAPFPAESARASASGLEISGMLGDGLTDAFGDAFGDVPLLELLVQPPTPLVEVAAPTEDGERRDEASDEVLEVPGDPVAEIGVLRVAALADLDLGLARAEAEAADVEVLPGAIEDEDALVAAEAIRAEANATCPPPGELDSDEALAAASQGTEFIGLTIAGEEVPTEVDPNTEIIPEELDGLVRIGLRVTESFGDPDGEYGYTVQALVIELLNEAGDEPVARIVIGEAEAAVNCE